MRNGLKQQLTSWLRAHEGWHAKNSLTALVWTYPDGRTYGAALVDRNLRRLEEESIIAVKYENGHGFYKYLLEYHRKAYIPTSQRTDAAKMWAGQEPPTIEYRAVEVDGRRVMKAFPLSTP